MRINPRRPRPQRNFLEGSVSDKSFRRKQKTSVSEGNREGKTRLEMDKIERCCHSLNLLNHFYNLFVHFEQKSPSHHSGQLAVNPPTPESDKSSRRSSLRFELVSFFYFFDKFVAFWRKMTRNWNYCLHEKQKSPRLSIGRRSATPTALSNADEDKSPRLGGLKMDLVGSKLYM